MSYTAEISRSNPACILFLLDQSGSMNEPFSAPNEPAIPKARGVADAVNRLITDLIVRCTQGDQVRDRFHIGAIAYGQDQAALAPGFTGLKALAEVAATPLRVEERVRESYDGTGGMVKSTVRFPVWFDPMAEGNTPMCAALDLARELLDGWAQAHPGSHPPIVFNITDGQATDGDPAGALQGIQQVATQDGTALVFNLLLADACGTRISYPADSEGVPAGPLRSLIAGSSVLPEVMRLRASQVLETTLPQGARGVVLNARLLDLIKLLDIGSQPGNA